MEVALDKVEANDDGRDTTDEEGQANWKTIDPVSHWVNWVSGTLVELAEGVGKSIENTMENHKLPVSLKQLNVSDPDVDRGHNNWGCMQDGHMCNNEPVHRSSREAFRDLIPHPWHQNYPETKGNCEVQRVCDLKPGIRHHVPVLSISGRQHGENLGDDSIGPAPQRPVVEERHQLELVCEHSHHRPKQMGNEQCPSDA